MQDASLHRGSGSLWDQMENRGSCLVQSSVGLRSRVPHVEFLGVCVRHDNVWVLRDLPDFIHLQQSRLWLRTRTAHTLLILTSGSQSLRRMAAEVVHNHACACTHAY